MLQLLKRRPAPEPSTTVEVGKIGEQIAARYLQSLPYHIKATNVKVGKRDEVDIIAYDPSDDVVVFVEVKSRKRKSEDFRPEFNFTRRKRTALWRAARRWMTRNGFECGYRIDLVCVAGGEVVDHFKEIRRPNRR